jgi:hypothetical protein
MGEIALGREVQGRAHAGNYAEQMARILASTKSGIYNCDVQNLNTGTTNTTWTSLSASYWGGLELSRAVFVEIFSTQAITVKFRTLQNAATAYASLPSIPIRANTLRTFDYIADVTELYFSNASGSTASIEVTTI